MTHIQWQLFLGLFVISVLTACVVSPTPQAPAEADATAPGTPVEVATATVEPTPTELPSPSPTLSPLPATPATQSSTEVLPDTSGDPDLNFAQVLFVKATQNNNGFWRFDTTVRHNDEGWDHYADAWQVLDLEGNLLAERILAHPHDTEQPFTRSQSNIEIPPEITQVIVRSKCNVHGFGGQEVLVDLTVAEGEKFEVTR